jgi:glycosyltransferase involved in cell wall biosynthesis
MQRPLFSIITVSFNSEKTIERTIRSVLDQTFLDFEYLVIDGKSKDSTLEIAQSFIAEFKAKNISYQIISEEDKGIYDAMNKGIDNSTGNIIAFINSDDWYDIDALEKVYDFHIHNPFDAMYSNLKIIKNSGNITKRARSRKFVTTRDWNFPSMFVKKKVYDSYRFAVSNIYDDFDFFLRIKNTNLVILTHDDAYVNFSFGGISTQKNFKKMLGRVKIRYQIYKKNGYNRLYWFECVFTEFIKYLIA